MTTAPIAFIDTETTGLTIHDEIWEFACIRRDPDGTEDRTVLHIEHNRDYMRGLPEKFRLDHDTRFGVDHHVYSRTVAAGIIDAALDGCHLVGANPAFDAGMLARLLDHANLRPSWHYHLIDLEATTVGYLMARGETVEMPWRSDDLAARVGAPTADPETGPLYDRHTALGDALWARDWWDALTTNGGDQ